jgi:hypothetical protein
MIGPDAERKVDRPLRIDLITAFVTRCTHIR